MTQQRFSEIGEAYAASYKALETARATYELERDRMLAKLADSAHSLTGRAPTRENIQYVTNYLPETRWSKTRAERKLASKAGFTVAIGEVPWFGNEGVVVFAAYSFFQMAGLAFGKIQGTPLGHELGIHLGGTPQFGRIKSRVIRVTDAEFGLDVFEQEIARLHEGFEGLDERVTSIYRQALRLDAPG